MPDPAFEVTAITDHEEMPVDTLFEGEPGESGDIGANPRRLPHG
jgi:hypothetical protein